LIRQVTNHRVHFGELLGRSIASRATRVVYHFCKCHSSTQLLHHHY